MAPSHRQRCPVFAVAVAAICLQLMLHAAANPLLFDSMTSSKDQGIARVASYLGTEEKRTSSLLASVIRGCTYGCRRCEEEDGNQTERDLPRWRGPTAFETEFVCPKHRDSYGSYDSDAFFALGDDQSAVGSCVWKVDPYASLVSLKRLNANNLIPRGRFSLARFGDVRATCILNSIAEQCGVPGCEKMVLSLQGHGYVSYVWTTTTSSGYTYDTSLEGRGQEGACCDLQRLRLINNNEVCRGRREGSLIFDGLQEEIATILPNITSGTAGKLAAPPRVQNSQTSEGDRMEDEFVYIGAAFIFSGTIDSIVTNDGKEQIKESGLFDFPFAAELRPYPRNLLPGGMLDELVKIHPQQMRLSFTTTGSYKQYTEYEGEQYAAAQTSASAN